MPIFLLHRSQDLKSSVLEAWSICANEKAQGTELFYIDFPESIGQTHTEAKEAQNAILANLTTAAVIAGQAYQKNFKSKILQAQEAELERYPDLSSIYKTCPVNGSIEDKVITQNSTNFAINLETTDAQAISAIETNPSDKVEEATQISALKKNSDNDEEEVIVDVDNIIKDQKWSFNDELDREHWANWTIEKDMPGSGTGRKYNGRWYRGHALERMAPDRPDVREELRKRAHKKALRRKLINPPPEETTKDMLDRYEKFIKEYIQPRGISPRQIENTIANGWKVPSKKHPGCWDYVSDKSNLLGNKLMVCVTRKDAIRSIMQNRKYLDILRNERVLVDDIINADDLK